MILHTIISPADIFFEMGNDGSKCKDKECKCITDPYFYLENDEYYNRYTQVYAAHKFGGNSAWHSGSARSQNM